MFQTEINHFLQSFAFDELTIFMRIITALGYPSFLMLFLVVLLFTFNFKKGFILFLVLLWTAMITFFFKDHFDLPRPFHVDKTLQFLDGQLSDEADFQFSGRGATSFWSGLPTDVLNVTRASGGVENGFPSGHTSCAIALWGAVMLLFAMRWVRISCILLMILIPLSRMYLGVHFLADVVGGILLGSIILGITYLMIFKPDKLSAYLNKSKIPLGLSKLSAFLLIAPLVGFLFLPTHYYLLISSAIGLGLGYLLVAHKGLPLDDALWWQRIGRTIIGIAIFIGIRFLMGIIENQIGLSESVSFDFAKNFLGSLLFIWMGTEIGMRLGWFNRRSDMIA